MVSVDLRGHTMPTPDGLEKFFDSILRLAKLDTSKLWTLRLGAQVRGRSKGKFFRLSSSDVVSQHAINCKIQPGGKDTCYEVQIVPPDGMDIYDIYRKLSQAMKNMKK